MKHTGPPNFPGSPDPLDTSRRFVTLYVAVKSMSSRACVYALCDEALKNRYVKRVAANSIDEAVLMAIRDALLCVPIGSRIKIISDLDLLNRTLNGLCA